MYGFPPSSNKFHVLSSLQSNDAQLNLKLFIPDIAHSAYKHMLKVRKWNVRMKGVKEMRLEDQDFSVPVKVVEKYQQILEQRNMPFIINCDNFVLNNNPTNSAPNIQTRFYFISHPSIIFQFNKPIAEFASLGMEYMTGHMKAYRPVFKRILILD